MGQKIRVVVVDDAAVVREALSQILNADPEIEVVATAADPYIAAQKMEKVTPDVITLDVEMPRMDGLTFLKKIMAQHPMPVIMCSSLVESGSETVIKALEYGAVDIIQKPRMGTKLFLEESRVRICDAVKAAARAKVEPTRTRPSQQVEPKLTADAVMLATTSRSGGSRAMAETTEKVVVVGASTGGTEALREFLMQFPADAPGIVIVQHMPENFTAAFARRLDGLCDLTVKEAADGDTVIRGRALIAPGNKHTLLQRSGARYYVTVKDGPLVSRHRPSVDVLFRSAARYAGRNCIGVIMTGMGDDGARGMKEMKDAGALNIAQDEATCVVYGMPKEAVKAGGTDYSLPLGNIAAKVLQLAR
jgi:two-component system chemotaxis response regulator CheB